MALLSRFLSKFKKICLKQLKVLQSAPTEVKRDFGEYLRVLSWLIEVHNGITLCAMNEFSIVK